MKIAIFGTHPAALLTAAFLSQDHDVTILSGGEDHDAFTEFREGWIRGKRYEYQGLRSDRLTCPQDLAFFFCSLSRLEMVYQQNHEYLEESRVVVIHPGIMGTTLMGFHYPQERIFAGLNSLSIRHEGCQVHSEGGWLWLGGSGPVSTPECFRVAKLFDNAFPVEVRESFSSLQWYELFLTLVEPCLVLTGEDGDFWFHHEEGCRMIWTILREARQVLDAAKIFCRPYSREEQTACDRLLQTVFPDKAALKILTKKVVSAQAGYLRHQFAMNNPKSDIDFLNGEIVQMAGQIGLEAPYNEKIVMMVHRFERERNILNLNDVIELFKIPNPS